jgi:cytochrome bd-type quinol oxidase subunit 2
MEVKIDMNLLYVGLRIGMLAFALDYLLIAASPQALDVISTVSLVFIPIMVAYESWPCYIFRKRIEADKHHFVY